MRKLVLLLVLGLASLASSKFVYNVQAIGLSVYANEVEPLSEDVAAAQDCQCWGDISGDFVVSTTDMNMLLFKLFEKVGTPGYEHDPVPEGFECMDFDDNNKLDTVDMGRLLMHLWTYGKDNPGWASPCMPEPY